MATTLTVWWEDLVDRVATAARILWYGPTRFTRLERLLDATPYLAVQRAVQTIDADPEYQALPILASSDHAKRAAVRSLARKLLHDEYAMTMGPYTWEINFLLEWCVGEERGRF